MNQHLQNILNIIQQDESMPDEQKNTVVKLLKDADKELEITAFKLDRTEKVKRTTAILLEETIEELEQKRKSVEAQNRELEIESSLERVRTVAMSMNKPDDLLGICEILFKELKLLGFSDLRNTLIHTFVDEKNYFNDYDFSEFTGGCISRIPYSGHPVIERFINQIRKNKAAFVETVVNGKEIEEWKEFRKKNGEADDPRLDHIQELFYYHYSVGAGDIGISTFSSIPTEKQNLLKRFSNVFDLAYKRYIDITQAIEQAKEAQIETSLERVRAQAMAMRIPEDLTGICEVLYAELHSLGFTEIRNAMINIHDDEKETFVNYDYSDEIGRSINHLHYNIHPLIEKQIKQIRSAEGFSETSYTGKDLEDMIRFRKDIGEKDDPRIEKADTLYYYFYSIGTGSIGISTFSVIAGEKLDVLKRFRNVFTLAYQRYTDIALAEAQAREAKIEAALERVRARTMAMQKSTDLGETSKLLFAQLNSLVPELWTCGFVLCDKNKTTDEWWLSGGSGFMPDLILPNVGDPLHNNIYKAWLAGESYYEEVITGEALQQHYDWLMTIPSAKAAFDAQAAAAIKQPAWQQLSCAYFSKGYLVVITEKTCAEENIFKRFAQVFEQTYTRFLDLQKAEAQAKEAKIEAALERVRSRSLAMHHSSELSSVVETLLREFTNLEFTLTFCIINLIDEQDRSNTVWAANPETGKDPESYYMKFEDYPFHHAMWKAWKEQQKNFIYTIEGEEKKIYDEYLYTETEFRRFPKHVQEANKALKRYVAGFTFFKHSGLQTVSENHISDEELNILERFGKVFEQSYTRFLDLQKAEAQAKEAQIEAALERVRSRSMAMHKSEELKEVIKITYHQLSQLKIKIDHAGFVVDYKPKGDWHFWIADEQDIPAEISHPWFDSVWARQFDEAKQNGKYFFATQLNFEEKNKFYNELLSFVPGLPEASKDFYLSCPGLAASTVLMDNVALYIENFSGIPYSAEENNILLRFGKVFQQTYTRFMDLQKAEFQAREAQIEAALERTRTQSMIMQHSSELDETLKVFHEQVLLLGIKSAFSFLWLPDEKNERHIFWAAWREDKNGTTVFNSKAVNYPLDRNEPATVQCFADWKSNEPVHSYHVQPAAVDNYFATWKELLDGVEKLNPEYFRDGLYYVEAFMKYGCFGVMTITDLNEAEKILLNRFAIEFERTYTRFLDLKKAESQARQAKIETALEKVRARALAMQQPEELKEVATVLRHEMGLLGVEELETCSIYIHDETINRTECWYALKDIRGEENKLVSDHFPLNLQDTWVGREMDKFYRSGAKKVSILMQGANRKEWINYCEERSIPLRGYYGTLIPDRTYHLYKFSHGAIGAASAGDISAESWDLLQRAASVFSLAYSRFKDLTQARFDLQRLKAEKQRAETALSELQTTQKQLIQSEKMASLGELTAGIAHEIQNPLNFVNNFSEVSNELIDEMNAEIEKGDMEEAKAIANDIKQNLEKINHHGKRADAIVKGMLQHSRSSSAVKEPTDINKLADEYLRLAYHGLRAKDKSFNAIMKTDFDNSIGNINVIPQDIGRVILNLITNAFYEVDKKKKVCQAEPLEAGYEPTVSVSTIKEGNNVLISVKDNGNGIPQKVLDKIFQPFFTTKPTGQGTGLGLSLSYDIVKAHGGELKVETKEGEGSKFIIVLPAN
ncbi:MAG: ATP-binding protein [Ferruginibacter sp.]